jgi:hypothetical protein
MPELPNELLSSIFDYLPRLDRCQCNLVCRRWSFVATRAIWRSVSFRLHPYHNALANVLHGEQPVIHNFTYTAQLEFDLVLDSAMEYNGDGYRQLIKDCLKNFELMDRICDNLPTRLSLLKLKFDRLAGHASFFRQFENLLIRLAGHDIEETRIDCTREPCDVFPLPTITPHVYAFQHSLTRIKIDFGWLRVILPAMSRLTHLEVQYNCQYDENWSSTNDWAVNLHTSPLETLHLQSIFVSSSPNLPQTITTLALIDMPQTWATLSLAFFTLPSLKVLMLGANGISELEVPTSGPFSSIHTLPLVSTKLITFVLAPFDLPAWLFTRMRETCHQLRTLLFVNSEDFDTVSLEGPILNHFKYLEQDTTIVLNDLWDADGVEGYLEAFFIGKGGVHFICCNDIPREFSPNDRYRLERLDTWPVSSGILSEISRVVTLGERRIHMRKCLTVEEGNHAHAMWLQSNILKEGTECWALFRVDERTDYSEGWEYKVSKIGQHYNHICI